MSEPSHRAANSPASPVLDGKRPLPVGWELTDQIEALRAALDGAGYTYEGVTSALGVQDLHSPRETRETIWRRHTADATPLNTLIRLLLIGLTVDAEVLRAAIAPLSLESWIALGLVATTRDTQTERVTGKLHIMPWRGLLVAYDRLPGGGRRLPTDYVMGVGQSTQTLANLTIQTSGGDTLDLGCGCGLLALRAATGADHVWAIDRNPRAVHLARFNATLNGFSNIECFEGDLFAPVSDRQFDQIVSNPPFVISPEQEYIYRDGGMEGDQISRRVVREAGPRLKEGGYCQVLCNWAHITGEEWQSRLAEWFEGSGCDAWILRCETQPAEVYADTWIRHTEHGSDTPLSERFDTWMRYYESQRIEAVSAGVITMRRRSDSQNWFRIEDAPSRMVGPCGPYVERAIKLWDYVASTGDHDVLLGQVFQAASDLLFETSMTPSKSPADRGWEMQQARVTLTQGLAWTGTLDTFLGALMAQSIEPRPLRELIIGAARAAGLDPAKAPVETLDAVRTLVAFGMLLPVQPP